ncbi:MAG: DUF456 family protein [Phycisphaerales bacterium]|nr:DUF456 family protein [Phycisphaerales bacterium]
MTIAVAITIVFTSLLGVALTLLTLPGIWFAILCAGLAQWWSMSGGRWGGGGEQMFAWWVLGTCVGLGVCAELIELFASAAGAAKAGGTRRGAIGSVIGGLFGALAGTFLIPIPVVGTLVGAAAGAGLGALLLERAGGQKTWKQSTVVGAGAAAGRLVATIIKAGFAGAIALILSLDAFL